MFSRSNHSQLPSNECMSDLSGPRGFQRVGIVLAASASVLAGCQTSKSGGFPTTHNGVPVTINDRLPDQNQAEAAPPSGPSIEYSKPQSASPAPGQMAAPVASQELLDTHEGVITCAAALSRIISAQETLHADGSRSIDTANLTHDRVRGLFYLYLLKRCQETSSSTRNAIGLGLNSPTGVGVLVADGQIFRDIASVLGESSATRTSAPTVDTNYVRLPSAPVETVRNRLKIGVDLLNAYAGWANSGAIDQPSFKPAVIAAVARKFQNDLMLIPGNFLSQADIDQRLKQDGAALEWAKVAIGLDLLSHDSITNKFRTKFSSSVGEIVNSDTDLETAYATFSKAVSSMQSEPMDELSIMSEFLLTRCILPNAYTGSETVSPEQASAEQLRYIALLKE